MEFLPLQRIRIRGPTAPGFASSRFRCGHRVSHPLAALRPPNPSGPFRPVTLLGFPLRSLSLPRSRDASRRPLPSCRYSLRIRPRPGGHGRPHRELGFTALLPAKVRHDRTGFSRSAARYSLEVHRSRAFRVRVAPRFRGAPLAGLASEPLARPSNRPLRVSIREPVIGLESRDPEIARSSAAALLRFSHLVSSSASFGIALLLARADGAGNLAVPRASVFGARANPSSKGLAEEVSVSSPGRHPTLANEYTGPFGGLSSPCVPYSYAIRAETLQPGFSDRVDLLKLMLDERSSG